MQRSKTTPVRPQRGASPDAAPAACPTIRLFRDDDWSAVSHFYESRYREGYILAQRDYFDWAFDRSPFLQDGEHGQRLVADPARPHGEHVVGVTGESPWPIQIGGERRMSQCTFNVLLDEEYRRSTLGYRLMTRAALGYPFTLAIGVRPIVPRLSARAGRVFSFEMDRWARVLDLDACERLVRASGPYAEMDDAEQTFAPVLLAEAARAPAAPAPPGARLERVERLGADWDAAWERIRPAYGVTTWRSAAFLNWRYADYPYPIYETRVLYLPDAHGGERVAGFVALREERPAFGRVLRIVDLVAEEGARGALLALVEREARRRECALVDFVAGGRADEEALAGAGYRTFDVEGWEGLLPFIMDPPKWRRQRVASLFALPAPAHYDTARYGHVPRPTAEVEAGAFYFTKGDGDLDRAF